MRAIVRGFGEDKMSSFKESDTPKQGLALLIGIIVATTLLPLLFFMVIEHWGLDGLPVYFLQLGIYLLLYLLAFVGLRRDNISLPVNARLIWQAVGWTLAGWLFYALTIHLLGLVKWPEAFRTLRSVPIWKIGAQIVSAWFFVGLGEEVLFRGYFLAGFRHYFTQRTSRRRTILASVLVSAFFSLWHLPVRISWLLSGELDAVTLVVSLIMLFLLGIGFAYLFVQTRNIALVGLVHGVMDYPLIGLETQLSFLVLLTCLGLTVIARLVHARQTT